MRKLHIGCFDVPLPEWYNTDITLHIWIARIPFLPAILHFFNVIDDVRYRQHREKIFRSVHYLNALKKFPLAGDSVDAIYSSHMLVNFTPDQAYRCLQECRRVLRPGGILRIAVPDLDEWIKLYDSRSPERFLSLMYLPLIKRAQNRIHWMYTRHSLKESLSAAGFRDITQCARYQGECPDVERIDYRSDSIFFECKK